MPANNANRQYTFEEDAFVGEEGGDLLSQGEVKNIVDFTKKRDEIERRNLESLKGTVHQYALKENLGELMAHARHLSDDEARKKIKEAVSRIISDSSYELGDRIRGISQLLIDFNQSPEETEAQIVNYLGVTMSAYLRLTEGESIRDIPTTLERLRGFILQVYPEIIKENINRIYTKLLDPQLPEAMKDRLRFGLEKMQQMAVVDHGTVGSIYGKGGMGIVRKVKFGGRVIAVKEIFSDVAQSDQFKKMNGNLDRKAFAQSTQKCDQLMTYLGRVHTTDGRVMDQFEFLEGENLEELMVVNNDVLSRKPEYLLALFLEIIKAIKVMHADGNVHRDLKPDNIILADREGKRDMVVCDFDLAKPANEPVEATNNIQGTPQYMSPEQIQGKSVGKESDIYALVEILKELFGCKRQNSDHISYLLEALQGQARLDDLNQMAPLLTTYGGYSSEKAEHFVRFLKKCIAVNAEARPADVAQLENEVLKLLESKGDLNALKEEAMDYVLNQSRIDADRQGFMSSPTLIIDEKPVRGVEASTRNLKPLNQPLAFDGGPHEDEGLLDLNQEGALSTWELDAASPENLARLESSGYADAYLPTHEALDAAGHRHSRDAFMPTEEVMPAASEASKIKGVDIPDEIFPRETQIASDDELLAQIDEEIDRVAPDPLPGGDKMKRKVDNNVKTFDDPFPTGSQVSSDELLSQLDAEIDQYPDPKLPDFSQKKWYSSNIKIPTRKKGNKPNAVADLAFVGPKISEDRMTPLQNIVSGLDDSSEQLQTQSINESGEESKGPSRLKRWIQKGRRAVRGVLPKKNRVYVPGIDFDNGKMSRVDYIEMNNGVGHFTIDQMINLGNSINWFSLVQLAKKIADEQGGDYQKIAFDSVIRDWKSKIGALSKSRLKQITGLVKRKIAEVKV